MPSGEAILFGVGISSVIYYFSISLAIELLFPVLTLYHVLTFSLTYKRASEIRRFLVSFSLVFADILLTIVALQQPWPAKLWLWACEFVVVYIMVANLTHDQIESLLAGKYMRTLVYIATGYFKAISLASPLIYLSRMYNPQEVYGFSVNLALGMSKMASTAIVYYFDHLVSFDANFDRASCGEILRRLKISLIAVCLVIESCAVWEKERDVVIDTKERLFNPSPQKIQLVAVCYMAVWYLNEAEEYGARLNRKAS